MERKIDKKRENEITESNKEREREQKGKKKKSKKEWEEGSRKESKEIE